MSARSKAWGLVRSEGGTWPLIGWAESADRRGDQDAAEVYMQVVKEAEAQGWPRHVAR